MKIGIMSDLHLGYRQYGLREREKDFYIRYRDYISQCIEENCDIVIIAGDIFHTHRPSPEAINIFLHGIQSLNKHNIEVMNIVGNHTQLQVKDHFEADYLFSMYNYTVLDESTSRQIDGCLFCGLPYHPNHNLGEFKAKVADFNNEAKEYNQAILVIHQEFQEYCGFTDVVMSIHDIEIDNFDYVICGHIHSRKTDQIGKTHFIQPGSLERLNTKEAFDESIEGKGLYLIDPQDDEFDDQFVRIENFRKIFSEEIVLTDDSKKNNLLFGALQEKISEYEDDQPMLSLKIYDKFGYLDLCKDWEKKLSDITLITRMTYFSKNDIQVTESVIDKEDLTPLGGLKKAVKDWKDHEAELALGLYHKLSSHDSEVVASAQQLSDEYLHNHFDI